MVVVAMLWLQLLRTGDPDELGLQVDENGIIID